MAPHMAKRPAIEARAKSIPRVLEGGSITMWIITPMAAKIIGTRVAKVLEEPPPNSSPSVRARPMRLRQTKQVVSPSAHRDRQCGHFMANAPEGDARTSP